MTGSTILRDRCDKFREATGDEVNGFEGVAHCNGEEILDCYQDETAGKPASRA
jgi:hypothetical protein